MSSLVIVESPTKAKTIEKYLGPEDFKVLSTYGHIRDLPSKEGSVVPEENFLMKYEVSDNSNKYLKELGKYAKKVDHIFLATDPDREGESISWHVAEVLNNDFKLKKNVSMKRVVFHEITRNAVVEAIKNPRDIDMNLVNAQQARRALDYLVGFTLSPILWKKLPGSKSAGRVQSVALRLICDRELEIEQFVAQEYWDIKANFLNSQNNEFTASLTYCDGDKIDKFFINNEKQANEIVEKINKCSYTVNDIEKKKFHRNPSAPFTTSSMQQEAARKLSFSAKKTMLVAQQLYEGIEVNGELVGLITYMRTDGVTVSKEAINSCRQLIQKEYGSNYVPSSPREYKTKIKNAQEAHEAIRPTNLDLLPEKIKNQLSKDQLALYDLIWKRMVASQMKSAVLDQVVIHIVNENESIKFRASGSTVFFDGFYKIYREGLDDVNDEGEKILPPVEKNEQLDKKEVNQSQHFTQPPPRFSEASLVKKLEELGIGRPSTYASIISVLQDRKYVKLDKRRFHPEELGRIVSAFLTNFFTTYVEYQFTADMEDNLDKVSAGELEWKELLSNFWYNFKQNTDEVSQCQPSDILAKIDKALENYIYPKDNDGNVDRKCPECQQGDRVLKIGRFGAFIACSNYPDCNYKNTISGTNEQNDSIGNNNFLGIDEGLNEPIYLKKGPYGAYVQRGEDKGNTKPKRVKLPKNFSFDDINLESAINLLSLPKVIGKHPETAKEIAVNIGPYGPYLSHDGKNAPIYSNEDIFSIGINRAVVLIANSKVGKSEILKNLGKDKDGNDVLVKNGKYGPYIAYKKVNAPVEDSKIATLTIEEAIKIVKSKPKSKKRSFKKKSSS